MPQPRRAQSRPPRRDREPSPRGGAAARARRLAAYLPALLWAALVLWIGSRPDVPAPDVDLPLDKAAHFLMYGALGALAARGWLRAGRVPGWAWPVAAAIAVGAADELNQSGIASRSPELADWLADAAGVIVGFRVFAGIGGRPARRNEREGWDE